MQPGLILAAVLVASSFCVEAIAVPRSKLRRPWMAIGLHVAALSTMAACCLAVTARPRFSAFVVVALIALLAVVGNAKFKSLREPFVFSDLSLFSQVFSHPRLYLPFLGVIQIAAIGIGLSIVVVAFLLEQPVAMAQRGIAALVAVGGLSTSITLSRRLKVRLDPLSDQCQFGFFATFVAYLINGLGAATRDTFAHAVSAGPFSSGQPAVKPDVIVIQSESYFDARQLGDCVLPGPYACLDRARQTAFEHGRLTVPAWGANTMRSEFAMLTGVPSGVLGYARFYPYMYVRRACASIAGWFKRGGYQTLAIHPYYADFFGRRRVFRFMSFDRFRDIQSFKTATRVGPYVGDDSVTEDILALLREGDDEPLFAFAITMENHGPLNLETVRPGEYQSRHALGDDARWRDLTAYLRHVENADRMLGKLIDYLRVRRKPTVLCFYGDHVPALNTTFDALGIEPTHSEYLIWRNFGENAGERRDLRVESLGFSIQRAMMNQKRVSFELQNEMQQAPARP